MYMQIDINTCFFLNIHDMLYLPLENKQPFILLFGGSTGRKSTTSNVPGSGICLFRCQ